MTASRNGLSGQQINQSWRVMHHQQRCDQQQRHATKLGTDRLGEHDEWPAARKKRRSLSLPALASHCGLAHLRVSEIPS